MIGLIILVAQIIILMTRMITQMCKSIGKYEDKRAAAPVVVFFDVLVCLHIWAKIQVFGC